MRSRNIVLKPDAMRTLGIKLSLIFLPKWKIFGVKFRELFFISY